MKTPSGTRHVLYVHPNSEVGGSDIALARTLEAMRSTGQRSSVILPCDGPIVERLRAAGAEVHFLPMQQLRTLPSVSYQLGYLLKFLPTVMRLKGKIRQIEPDLVHSNSLYCLYGAWAAKLAGKPHIWHVREMAPSVPVLTPLFAAMVRRLSTIILAMSDPCVDALYGLWPRQVVVMPDALDGEAFRKSLQPGHLRADLGVGVDTPIVGFAARLDPWKGCHVFLDACALVAARHPKAIFVVSGGSPPGLEGYERELKRKAAALGLGERLHFLGWRYRLDSMVDLMDGLDVFCHTSITPEPFGLVLLEAMSVGTPVVSVKAGGPLAIVEDGVSGILLPPGDAPALAEQISSLLEFPDRATAIGAAGRLRQEQEYSVPIFVKRLSAIYERALPPGNTKSR
ncbi:glycosyltransferase family 4 protein [Mycoplana rhizolycopersici]|uniref:Glycosyltransferase family 4 protein n=1 Tax=Mycoplana rhizolycopersici TaxID=2746702 RepID=A0ABX2QCI7_9HYPH|nr:glycosyltransferase family 4 protein [Rhizobium rhizolycopersici]NVP55365.1 glycosyltransferase family 4 protein [Rhizobium rhizolycopersici]